MLFLVSCFAGIFWKYIIEIREREAYLLRSITCVRTNNGLELLSVLMPKFVIDRIKSFNEYGMSIADDAGEVTLLFCDIDKFDEIVKVAQNDIVKILDELFRGFDKLCVKHGLQKIETVGKTWMAAGGLNFVENNISEDIKQKNYTTRAIELGMDMMKFVSKFRIKNIERICLKIGIHHGECIMGIIGYHKPQFSLIGDTINVTSRHCTTGSSSTIMVSTEAWARSELENIIFKKVQVDMKGKGLRTVYHIACEKMTFLVKFLNGIKNIDRLYAAGKTELSINDISILKN